MDYYTYMLCCWKTKSGFTRHRPLYGHIIYTGYTYNIFQRLTEHIKGTYKKAYTHPFRGKIRLGYFELSKTRKAAMNREAEIKLYSRDKKIKMIYDFQNSHPDILDFIKNNMELLLNK